jgi:hypothetical protein
MAKIDLQKVFCFDLGEDGKEIEVPVMDKEGNPILHKSGSQLLKFQGRVMKLTSDNARKQVELNKLSSLFTWNPTISALPAGVVEAVKMPELSKFLGNAPDFQVLLDSGKVVSATDPSPIYDKVESRIIKLKMLFAETFGNFSETSDGSLVEEI